MRARTKTDIFQLIDMSGGIDACWDFQGTWNERAKQCYWKFQGRNLIPYRVVWELVYGEVLPPEIPLLHSCDNRKCCNVRKHLKKGTHQQNMDEMKQRERHGLPHHAVRAIKRLIQMEISDADIATRFGISRRHVNSIRHGVVYSHVTLDEQEDSTPNTTSD